MLLRLITRKQYDVTSSYLSNRNIAYELRNNKEESRRNVLGGQAFVTVNLPYDFSVTVKGKIRRCSRKSTSGVFIHLNITSLADQWSNKAQVSVP